MFGGHLGVSATDAFGIGQGFVLDTESVLMGSKVSVIPELGGLSTGVRIALVSYPDNSLYCQQTNLRLCKGIGSNKATLWLLEAGRCEQHKWDFCTKFYIFRKCFPFYFFSRYFLTFSCT